MATQVNDTQLGTTIVQPPKDPPPTSFLDSSGAATSTISFGCVHELKPIDRDPINVLRRYLKSLSDPDGARKDTNHSSSAKGISSQQRNGYPLVNRHDEILRVADFLFGNSGNGVGHHTLLDGALAILDSSESLITKVLSIVSQRSLYLVKGSSSNVVVSNSNNHRQQSSEYYMCLFPIEDDDDKANLNQQSESDCGTSSVYYCSCRSFLERSRSSAAASTTCVCKHLLALTLMTSLSVKPTVVETVSDQEFSNFVTSRLGV